MLDIAHGRFNQKRYREAAAAYQEVLQAPHPERGHASIPAAAFSSS